MKLNKMYTIVVIICIALFVICLTGCFTDNKRVEGSVVYETEKCVITSEKNPVNDRFYIIRKYRKNDGEWNYYEIQSEDVNVGKTISRLIKEENS